MEPLTDVRDISRIAYGFIASKALFAALELDLFSRLLEPKTIDALARESGIPAHRVKTLLTTLTALGLIGTPVHWLSDQVPDQAARRLPPPRHRLTTRPCGTAC